MATITSDTHLIPQHKIDMANKILPLVDQYTQKYLDEKLPGYKFGESVEGTVVLGDTTMCVCVKVDDVWVNHFIGTPEEGPWVRIGWYAIHTSFEPSEGQLTDCVHLYIMLIREAIRNGIKEHPYTAVQDELKQKVTAMMDQWQLEATNK